MLYYYFENLKKSYRQNL